MVVCWNEAQTHIFELFSLTAHTNTTLLVIRIVYEDFVWMLKAKKRGGIKPPRLTLRDALWQGHITPLSLLLR